MPTLDLPVWELRDRIVETLQQDNRLVLVAATGSGKTTQVPQMILDAGLAGTGRIVVLQPRRVAARTVATRVAWERKCRLGEEVGYQVRFDDRLGDSTRIAFVTEGILLRWLQNDDRLRDVSVVMFDEFHERNLMSDVALALVRQIQATTRPDLKIVVMSATLEAEPVSNYLSHDRGPATVLSSEGRTFPVEMRWLDYGDRRPITEQAGDKVERIIEGGFQGDILVFMPGMAEINATINAIRASSVSEPLSLVPLHGDLSPDDQDRAFQASPRRKVVVATNVAETSVTIDGIRHVVDGGQARVARYDAERGIQTLMVEEISRASADQRAGRAGRTAPGTCWRLWTESGHLNRPAKNTPEIQRADLAEVVLLLHSLGIRHAADFGWLDKPDRAATERAERLLTILGALSTAGDLTPIGRQMLRLPMHPRFSRMLVEASARGCVPAAAMCAALVSGRDLLMRVGRDDPRMSEAREVFEGSELTDFHTLMRAQQHARNCNFNVESCRRAGIHAATARQVEDTYHQLMAVAAREKLVDPRTESAGFNTQVEEAPKSTKAVADDPLLICLTAGFADQLAVRKDSGSLDCWLTEGRSGTLVRESVVQRASVFTAATIREVSGRNGAMTLLGLGTVARPEWLEMLFPQHLSWTADHLFDRTHRRVAAIRRRRFLDLAIATEHSAEVDPEAAGRCLAEAFARGQFDLPLLDHEVKQFIARVFFVVRACPELEFPAFDAIAMTRCLTQAFCGLTLVKEAQALPLLSAFERHLEPAQREWLNELAPRSITGPGGKMVRLTYAEPDPDAEPDEWLAPEIQVKLTECFALASHPAIAEGKVSVRFQLQAPDGKRLATTDAFQTWKSAEYPKLRSTLKTKYPGFMWP